jgi:hypothetical protein
MKRILFIALIVVAHLAGAAGHHSGIMGQVFLIVCPVIGPAGCPPEPYQTTISIFNDKGKLVEEVTTDEEGLFTVDLKPGSYRLVPKNPEPPHIWPFAYPQDVRVERKQFTEVTIDYSSGL